MNKRYLFASALPAAIAAPASHWRIPVLFARYVAPQRERSRTMRIRSARLAHVIAVLALMALPGFRQSANAAPEASGFVYVMTNDPSGNAIRQYSRSKDGQLTLVDQESTRGLGGTGNGVGNVDPLGSQNSLILSSDGTRLLAVNGGSNEISSLRADSSGLVFVSKIGSGGTFPNSVALAGNLVYVLNALGTPNVTGFSTNSDGALVSLAGSTRNLPGGTAAAPHDIRFTPDGTRLIVTEGGTNQIDIFELDAEGLITDVSTEPSSGAGPFGFTFGRRGVLIVAEVTADAVSSYQLTNQNSLNVISASVPNGQMASCWISVTRNGHVFISNPGSGTLSSYQAAADGTLNLVKAVAASTGTGSAPIDSALSNDGRFLYVQDSALGSVLIFRVNGNNLASVGSVTDFPTTLQGIVAQ